MFHLNLPKEGIPELTSKHCNVFLKEKQLHVVTSNYNLLRWLETVFSTFQDLKFDESL